MARECDWLKSEGAVLGETTVRKKNELKSVKTKRSEMRLVTWSARCVLLSLRTLWRRAQSLQKGLKVMSGCVALWFGEVPGDAAVHGVWRRGGTVGGGHQGQLWLQGVCGAQWTHVGIHGDVSAHHGSHCRDKRSYCEPLGCGGVQRSLCTWLIMHHNRWRSCTGGGEVKRSGPLPPASTRHLYKKPGNTGFRGARGVYDPREMGGERRWRTYCQWGLQTCLTGWACYAAGGWWAGWRRAACWPFREWARWSRRRAEMTWRFWGGREEEVTVTDSIQQKTTWKHFYSNDTEKKTSVSPLLLSPDPRPRKPRRWKYYKYFTHSTAT